MDMTASTNSIWIKPPTEYTKNPKIQPIKRITAIMYNSPLMI